MDEEFAFNSTVFHLMNESALLRSRLNDMGTQVDKFFTSIMAIVVIILHTGFGFLEVGSVRSKNATSVVMKNMLDLLLGAFGYWIVGYTLAYGRGSAFLGMYPYIAGHKLGQEAQFANWFLQFSYAITSSSIISGVIVERCTFLAYLVYSVFTTAVTYPVVSHWAWSPEGWLGLLGFKDFAGSGVVHLCGGSCAVVACVLIGPRQGRYPKKADAEFDGHSTPAVAMGGMVLFVGFLAFNCASLLHISQPGDGELVAKVIVNTVLSGSGGVIGGLLASRLGLLGGDKYWSYLHTLNVGLFGMVSVCANCDAVDIWAAWVIALCGGIIYSGIVRLLEKLEVDDPLNAIAVHFGGGLWGLLASSVLREEALQDNEKAGRFLAYNCIGALAIVAWSMAVTAVIFGSLRYAGVLRPSEQDECVGMDLATHHEPAYAFTPADVGLYQHHEDKAEEQEPLASVSGAAALRHKNVEGDLTDPFLAMTGCSI
ncbi:Hypothetical predicted protein [Cloeon dipterum]|uniref:Ammonium transporter AmtB-like domain-containing protein n=2 Tax=Cloeon dipterum TaxID=197152 RepID=A0A8S1CY18_9INSE|nr:Hypothetical predicted protein [Cloeon dipterum]